MARPKKGQGARDKVDAQLVLDLARIGCTPEEIAAVCKIGRSTVVKQFPDELAEGYAHMKQSIRRKQLEVALTDKNPSMLIHLGKTILKQNDQLTIVHEESEIDDMPTDQLIEIVRNNTDKITH